MMMTMMAAAGVGGHPGYYLSEAARFRREDRQPLYCWSAVLIRQCPERRGSDVALVKEALP